MGRNIRVAAVQDTPLLIGSNRQPLADQVAALVRADPAIELIVYPELHLFNTDLEEPTERNQALLQSAIELTDPLIKWLGDIASSNGIWFCPGSICELADGKLFNTSLVFNPEGALVSTYRKIFPWRPYEPYTPGGSFEVFDIPGKGSLGMSICYDAWFPEVTRNLAWMGAELVLNIVKTTTPDRAQELVLAQANSIVNQTFTVSVNCAGPTGFGQSIIVDPEGKILAQAPKDGFAVLTVDIDLDEVSRVRTEGTAGTNRMWSQFEPNDIVLELPVYQGRINPQTWQPNRANQSKTN